MEEELNAALRKQLDLALRERDAARRTIEDNYLVQHKLNTRIKELENVLETVRAREHKFHDEMTDTIMVALRWKE